MAEITTTLPYSQQVDGDRGFAAAGEYFPERLILTRFSKAAGAIAAGDTVPLVKLPGGRVLIVPQLSYIAFSDTFTATADGHLGHRAYVNSSGATVAADDNEWIDNADVGGGAIAGSWTTAAPVYVTAAGGATALDATVYDAQDGLVIEVLIDTEAGSASSTIAGWVAWMPVP